MASGKAVHAPVVDRKKSGTANKPGVLAWAGARQLGISLSIILVVLAGNVVFPPDAHLSTHYTPSPSYHLRNVFARFIFISFRKPGTDSYYKGRDDAYFIAWWVVMFWFVREALMRWMLEPFARWTGIKERRSVVRFAEQGYTFIYYSVFWLIGLYIMQSSPYRNLNTKEFYVGYPHDALSALTKWYYLVQTAFWIQQIIVLNLEERRKDYVQMFAHHIITTALMSISYVFNYTRVGNAILCTMDLVDIILPLAKLLKYSNKPKAADIMFAIFLLTWIITRHLIFAVLLWSVYVELPAMISYGWRPLDGHFQNHTLHYTFCTLLTALQVILCIWLWMILRIVYKMVVGGASAEDTRSDDEGGDGEDDDEVVMIEAEETLKPRNGSGTTAAAKMNGGAPVELERKKDR